MARFKDHEEALKLRTQGMSYNQIKKALSVNKSTLSYWLRRYPLSKERIRELRDFNEARIEKFRVTMRKKKEERLNKYYKEQKEIIFPLRDKELYIAGLFLYWGEGGKTHETDLSVSNTDPAMIKFFIKWLIVCLKVPKSKLRIYLHLYQDMDIEQEMKYWADTLDVPNSQFTKPYIKKNLSENINHKGGFGHGTCNVRIGNARLTEKILMAIKAISDKYSKN